MKFLKKFYSFAVCALLAAVLAGCYTVDAHGRYKEVPPEDAFFNFLDEALFGPPPPRKHNVRPHNHKPAKTVVHVHTSKPAKPAVKPKPVVRAQDRKPSKPAVKPTPAVKPKPVVRSQDRKPSKPAVKPTPAVKPKPVVRSQDRKPSKPAVKPKTDVRTQSVKAPKQNIGRKYEDENKTTRKNYR